MIIWTNSPNPLECAYPLGATEGEVMSFGLGGRLTLSNSDQTGTYAAAGLDQTFGAFPTNPFSAATATLDLLSSGVKVVEFEFAAEALTADAGASKIDTDAYVSTTLGETIVSARLRSNADGSFTAVIFRGATQVASVASVTLTGGKFVIGLEFDCDAGTFRAIVGGSNEALSDNTFTPQEAIMVFTTQETALDAADVGKLYATTARTAAADIVQTYAVGATDACGNALT